MKVYRAKKASFALLAGVVFFVLSGSIFGQNMFRKINDFDGDGKADYAITRGEGGVKYWWIWQTTAGLKVIQFGLNSDLDAAGDYDGDGKTDAAVWRPASTNGTYSTYYILESQTNAFRYHAFTHFMFSQRMHQDYNGDGKTDPAVLTGETNPVLVGAYSGSNSSFGFSFSINERLGLKIGDMDGDSRAEYASYNVNKVITRNLTTNAVNNVQFGLFSDFYQAADFDGDGKGDLTVFRESNGTWWWIRSSDGVINAAQFGQSGDKPVPADYDGDGKTDLAIWRGGVYWILGSQSGLKVFNWGVASDIPVAY